MKNIFGEKRDLILGKLFGWHYTTDEELKKLQAGLSNVGVEEATSKYERLIPELAKKADDIGNTEDFVNAEVVFITLNYSGEIFMVSDHDLRGSLIRLLANEDFMNAYPEFKNGKTVNIEGCTVFVNKMH